MAEEQKDSSLHSAAVKLGSAGGEVGGPKRASVLSDEEKSEISRKGGLAKALKERQLHHKKSKKLSIKSKLKRTLKKRKSKKKETSK